MIQQATYSDGTRTATVKVERVDTWLEAADTVFRFPSLVELDGDRLFLTANRAPRGAPPARTELAVLSNDGGRTWRDAPSPMFAGVGSLGYLRDGSILGIDHDTVEAARRGWDPTGEPFHVVMQQQDPTFRLRHWSRRGEPLESVEFKVQGLPWTDRTASYQSYAKILELDNGGLLTALEALVGPPEVLPEAGPDGRPRHRFEFTTFIVRSVDGGRSWDCLTVFDPKALKLTYGPGDRPLEQGFCEADLARLTNGDILCVMRTGSTSPMFQARSTDGGTTWSTPESTGWQGVRPRLRVLPDGLLVCTAGRGAYGHPQITHVMLSLDGTGRCWEYPFAFHTGPGCSYTGNMVRDGKLHVVYSHSDFTREMGTHDLPSQTIKRAVIDVQLRTG